MHIALDEVSDKIGYTEPTPGVPDVRQPEA